MRTYRSPTAHRSRSWRLTNTRPRRLTLVGIGFAHFDSCCRGVSWRRRNRATPAPRGQPSLSEDLTASRRRYQKSGSGSVDGEIRSVSHRRQRVSLFGDTLSEKGDLSPFRGAQSAASELPL